MNKKIVKLKFSAYKLRDGGQIPSFIFEEICKLGFDTSIDVFKFWMEMSEHYLRIKGYYFKYPEIQETIKNDIKKLMKERGLDK